MLDLVAHPLGEPFWVAAHLDDGDVRVIDARWRGDGTSRELYGRDIFQERSTWTGSVT